MPTDSPMTFHARLAEVSVEKYREAIGSTEKDLLAVEEPLEIKVAQRVNGVLESHILTITMRTPGNDESLVLGFLYAEGIIKSIDDVERLEVESITGRDKPFTASLIVYLQHHITFKPEALQRNFFSTSSCGVCGRLSLNNLPNKTPGLYDNIRISAAALSKLPEQTRSRQTLFQHSGGLHAAALFDTAGKLISLSEDIGRHNAMDKLIGKTLSHSESTFTDKIVLLSGRVSYELMQKAVVAGIPIIAAIGAPSSLAVEIANKYDATLVGFLRDNRFNVYAGKERVQA